MNSLSAPFWEDVTNQFMAEVDPILKFIADQLTAGGVVGDVEITDDAEFAAYYVDLANRGVLEMLKVVDMSLWNEYTRRFQRVAAKLMEVA